MNYHQSSSLAPPFDIRSAILIVQRAEDLWNSKISEEIAKVYTIDSLWRNRTEFIIGRKEIIQFLDNKWKNEHNYKLRKELWGFRNNRIAVQLEYEFLDNCCQWYHAYGVELWEFNEFGLIQKRIASINNLKISK